MPMDGDTDLNYFLLNRTFESCALKYEDFTMPVTASYCNWTWDSVLCWPPTPAGTIVRQKCPLRHGLDPSRYAERRCSVRGEWIGRNGSSDIQNYTGWTNYTPCYTPEMQHIMNMLYLNGNTAKDKFNIAERTRVLEIVGFSISLAALILSLVIFLRFRSLRNNRTRIHKNLFVAMVIQVLIRLILYIDQAVIRAYNDGSVARHGIDNTPLLCEACYVLLEYARTAMFMWMFIEGLYLHNMVTVTVFQVRFPFFTYIVLGWGGPIFLTAIWGTITAKYQAHQQCWWGYNLTYYYWILEGPRLTVILLNFCFLLNIIRVLVVKLRQSQTSDIEQVRKAVRAAVVLLPLLGITNILSMTAEPLKKSVLEFALWSYTTHFLTSFQGFFIALLYCFLNGEVRSALLKSFRAYIDYHGVWNTQQPRRQSFYSVAYTPAMA
ncbi:PDF receptor [Phlebotomus argentipes]|uniref:PDF receptor n=1 Tax=Phlebotomus argentipes TaxID=94469 RepID=UPI0028932CEE|nr:PDF receptor [Phlebotomus argentipes]XP_059607497.1 PDF receptor [Phlebotomus argentipes]XP_059607498.1 PDF receptor [Phlebotomus argentipes]